jgi:hypothetical protein
MKRILATSIALLTLAGLAGCSDDSTPTGGEVKTPPASLTFKDFVGPLFAANCTNGACHGSTPGQSGFSVLSYTSVLAGGNNSGRNGIVLNDTTASIVFQKIGDTPPFGARMPRTGPPYLAQSTIDSIAMWILAGAPNTL